MKSALGIEVEILFGRNEQKDCNIKPDPQGNAQNRLKWSKTARKGVKQITFDKRQNVLGDFTDIPIYSLYFSNQARTAATLAIKLLGVLAIPCDAPGILTIAVSTPSIFNAA